LTPNNWKQINISDRKKSRRIQREVPSNVQNQVTTSRPRSGKNLSITNSPYSTTASSNNNVKLAHKIKAVVDHKIEGLNLTVGDAAIAAVVIFAVFMLRKMPIIAAAMAIVIFIVYKQGKS
jgi:hypothetical protein